MDTFNDRTSALRLLATRRSGKARDMIAPGPDAVQLRTILEAGMRVPDHGKLAPWRFVIVGADRRAALGAALAAAYAAENPGAGDGAGRVMMDFATQAPTLVVVLSRPDRAAKIPLWEQQLSCGAAIMNLMLAAHAMGFVANWLTGWAAYAPAVRDLFGDDQSEIAGYIFIGSPGRPLEERPRPAFDQIVSAWQPPAGTAGTL